jgi:hypothetical protein
MIQSWPSSYPISLAKRQPEQVADCETERRGLVTFVAPTDENESRSAKHYYAANPYQRLIIGVSGRADGSGEHNESSRKHDDGRSD